MWVDKIDVEVIEFTTFYLIKVDDIIGRIRNKEQRTMIRLFVFQLVAGSPLVFYFFSQTTNGSVQSVWLFGSYILRLPMGAV